jgi:hypothetical protein
VTPASAKAGRGDYFRAGLRSRTAFWALFAGIGASVVLAAARHDARIAVVGTLATVIAVVGLTYRSAARKAELEFFVALAPTLGMTYLGETGVVGITPLLAAGDRRRLEHTLEGNGAQLGMYTYEVRRQRSRNDPPHWDPYYFTVCIIDLAPTMPSYPGVYLRRRQGLIHGDDWLRHARCRRVEVESIAFNERYDILCAPDQDELALRELFSPKLVDWLATHPLEPGLELRAGVLVVWLAGHIEDAGKLAFFLDGARHLADTVSREAQEAAATGV